MQMSRAKILAGLFFIILVHGTILSTSEAKVFHSTPKEKLKRRKFPYPFNNTRPSNPRPFIPTYDLEQQEYVKAHNDLRRTLGMPPLEWDSKLAYLANSWGMERRKDCNYRNHSSNRFGENTFWMQYKEFTPMYVVQKWFSERQLFDHTTNRCQCTSEEDDCECGHYLNVIWKTTKRVGCSIPIYCAEEKGLLVICNYDPAGNIPGINPLDPSPQQDTSFDRPMHLRSPPQQDAFFERLKHHPSPPQHDASFERPMHHPSPPQYDAFFEHPMHDPSPPQQDVSFDSPSPPQQDTSFDGRMHHPGIRA